MSYNLGVLYKPHEKVSLGVSFRGPTTVHIDGYTETQMAEVLPSPAYSSAEAHLPLPLAMMCGVSYRPTPKWNIEFDAAYTDWSTLGTVTVNQSAPVTALGIPQHVPLIFDWQSSWYYELGATRYLGKNWSVSAGYIFNQNSMPDSHYNPAVADLDRHFLSVGAGFKIKRYDFDIAYQLGLSGTRTVSGGTPADGRYEFSARPSLCRSARASNTTATLLWKSQPRISRISRMGRSPPSCYPCNPCNPWSTLRSVAVVLT